MNSAARLTDLLDALQKRYAAASLPVDRVAPPSAFAGEILFVRFEGFGRGEVPLDFAFSFVLLPAEATKSGVYLLQTLCEFRSGIPTERWPELLGMLARINIQMPIGAFGFTEERGSLHLKCNCLLDMNRPTSEIEAAVDRQAGLMLQGASLFVDALCDVARGTMTSRAALASTPVAKLFADP